MESILLLLLFFFAQLFDELAGYDAGIILTAVPKFVGFPDTPHIYMIPGTPNDLAVNESLYEADIHYEHSSLIYSKLQSCKIDYSKKVLYMYDKKYSAIQAIRNFDIDNGFDAVSDPRRIYSGVSPGNVKVAVDWVSHNIYWTDPIFRTIVMKPGDPNIRDTSLYKIIVKEDLERPHALAVDSLGRHIYWSDLSNYPKIERATLTGDAREIIISTGLLFPLAIDVDVSGTNRRIYWVDADRDTVESANLAGEDRRIIKRLAHSTFYDVAIFKDTLSIVDVAKGNVLFISKSDGQMIANPYSISEEIVWGICIYHAELQPDIEDHCATRNCSDICVNEGDQATCLCREGFHLTGGSACVEDVGIYHRGLIVSDGNAIYLADIRSITAGIATYSYETIYTSTVGQINFLTLDMADRKVIFSTDEDIYSIEIDMENPTPQYIGYPMGNITGLSVDWLDKNIYWTSGTTFGSIFVASQTTRNIFTLLRELDHPRGIKILALETKMIWVSGTSHNNSIEMANIDGTMRQTIIGPGNLTDPQSLDFDSHTNKLYLVDSGYIKVVNLYGTTLDILEISTQAPNLLLVYKHYLVWTEDTLTETTLKSADTRAPSTTIISDSFPNMGLIKSFAVLDETMQPQQKGPCEADNGGCEHICIPIGRNRICRCEYGFQKESDGRSCSSDPLTDNFLLVTDWSHKKLYQVSLKDDEDVRALDIDSSGNPNAVIYNPFDKTVIWADTKNQLIRSVVLNTSYYRVLIDNEAYGGYADRLAVDSTSGNLYYTSVNTSRDGFVGVSVISPRGDHTDIVEGGHKPRDIVVDPEDGLMFWTDHGSVPSVKKANMDGSFVTVIVSQNIKWPNGLAIDYKDKLLFITDGYYDTIQKCNYTGACSVIYSDPGSHLMDIELMDVYLYYTAWNKPYITKLNRIYTSDISFIAADANLGRLDSISSYSSSGDRQPVNQHCLQNRGLGDCSTFCLPTQDGYKCACQNGINLGIDNKICEDVGTCPSDMLNINITSSCTFLHGAECFYTCAKFYVPATDDNRIKCLFGEWDYSVPCIFGNVKCPETYANVSFGRACSYRNGALCTYRCSHYHKPTSPDGTMSCDNGVWDNPDPCTEKVPHCPNEIDNVRFLRACTFQNDEECGFICQNGLVSATDNSRMTCINGSWEVPNPCIGITTTPRTTIIKANTTTIGHISSNTETTEASTTRSSDANTTMSATTTKLNTTITSPTTPTSYTSAITRSSSPSSSQKTEAATPAPSKKDHSVISIAVGVSVGVVVLLVIVALSVVFICKRSRKLRRPDGFQEFHSPCYGLDELTNVPTVPTALQQQRPNTTYDLINFDEPETNEGMVNTAMISNSEYVSLSKRSPVTQSGEYQTLTFGHSDYLHPVTSRTDAENFI